MNLNLEITKDFINFFDTNTGIIYNQIPISKLAKTIIFNNKVHSYWIEKYFNHIFIRKEHLYKLAQFINKELPYNEIDWFSQFYKIEYYQKLLDIEYFQSGNSETFNRDLFSLDQSYLNSCAEELSKNSDEVAKIKGKVLTGLTGYDLF